MAKIRLILIAAVVLVMGGMGYMQFDKMQQAKAEVADRELAAAVDKFDSYEEYAASQRKAESSSGGAVTTLIKSTKTISRVGGDKTITIQRKAPGIIMRIRMWFGYKPEDAHRRDFARLKAQRESEALLSKGVNNATGRKESTATRVSSSGSGKRRQAAPNKTLAGALGAD